MKKEYRKPIVLIESFALAEHIASCGTTTVGTGNNYGKPNHYNGSECVFIANGGFLTWFLESNEKCTETVDPEHMDIGCYNTPDGTISMFAS